VPPLAIPFAEKTGVPVVLTVTSRGRRVATPVSLTHWGLDGAPWSRSTLYAPAGTAIPQLAAHTRNRCLSVTARWRARR